MKIFLILPFKSEFEDIYEATKQAISFAGHSLLRAEDFAGNDNIEKIVDDSIKDSDFVIADISNFEGTTVKSEFYRALKYTKPIIPLCVRGKDIPIDLSDYQAIIYDRFRLNETLTRPLISYLEKSDTIDFLLKKTNKPKSKVVIKSIFVSYSHVDSIYLDRLKVHLRPFEKKGQIDLWEDTKIKAGEKWKDKINSALDKSVIAILLISADFMASDFIIDNELPPLLKAAEEKGKVILPVIVKPCRFTKDENLSKFQSVNDPKNPLSKLNENDKEEIYVKIADYIDNLVR